jgi:hypothetical protein
MFARFSHWLNARNLGESTIPKIDPPEKIEPIFFYIGFLGYLEYLSSAIFYAQCVDADKENLEARNKKLYDLNEELRVENNRLNASEKEWVDVNKRLLKQRNSLVKELAEEKSNKANLISEVQRLNILLGNELINLGEHLD